MLHELKKKQDDLFDWARETRGLFEPITEEAQACVTEILKKFPRFIDTSKGRNIADPWVVAMAREKNATVVTRETIRNRGPDRYGIPDVCASFNIPCINDHQFVHDVGMRFEVQLDPPIEARPQLGFGLQ